MVVTLTPHTLDPLARTPVIDTSEKVIIWILPKAK